MKYYIIYERYTEYNQFEGSWDIYTEEFNSLPNAKEWMKNSYDAKECRQYERKLIGPLVLCK